MELSGKTVYGPVLKTTELYAHVQNHVSLERCCKSFTTIVLGDHDFPLTASNFGNLTSFRAIFSHIFTAHAQKWLFMNFRLKFWHNHSTPWPQFPYRARYFGNLRTSPDDFCIGLAECQPYFYFHSSWPTDLESVSRDAHLAVKVSTKFEVDTTIRCIVIALLLLIRYVTLWPWPFNLAQWSYMAGHVVNPSTKFEDPTANRSWVISSDITHRIPLTVRLQPLRMRSITWPMRSGKFFPDIWNPWPRFAYSLCNFFGATIKINGVIWQNSAWPCVKDHAALCACAKSRQPGTLP